MLKIIHRVAWKNVMEEKMHEFRIFMNYIYGKDHNILMEVVNDNRDNPDGNYRDMSGYMIQPQYANCDKEAIYADFVRKEFSDEWEFLWSSYSTNPYLKSILQIEDNLKWSNHVQECIFKEYKYEKQSWNCKCTIESFQAKSTNEEDIVELNEVSGIQMFLHLMRNNNHWGRAWIFALNKMMMCDMNSCAMTNALVKCTVMGNVAGVCVCMCKTRF